MILLVKRTLKLLERGEGFVRAAVRFAVGWHLAYMGVWALTSTYD